MIEVQLPTQSDLAQYTGKTPTAAQESQAKAEFEKLKAQGWAAVLEVPAAMVPAEITVLKANKLYTEITTPVAGGRIFSTALLNVLIANDGRVFAGSVTIQKLLEAAAK